MKILIVAATRGEVSSLLKAEHQGLETGLFPYENCDVLITGVGIHATVFQLTRCLSQSSYDLIMNAGICGCFDKQRQLAEIVNVTTDFFGDLGAESPDGFLDAYSLGLFEKNNFPFVDGKLCSADRSDISTINELSKVSGTTVQTVHGAQQSIDDFLKSNAADTESMEGAAVFYVAAMMNTKCIQIRAISNYVEARNRAAWKIKEAIENLNIRVQKIINELSVL
jgi:futalosine hydrolase